MSKLKDDTEEPGRASQRAPADMNYGGRYGGTQK